MANPKTKSKSAEGVNRPVHKSRVGHVTASVWESTNKDGVVSYSITIQKSYKDDKDAWQNTDFLWASDALTAMKALDRAHTWILEQYDNKE